VAAPLTPRPRGTIYVTLPFISDYRDGFGIVGSIFMWRRRGTEKAKI